MQTNFFYQAPSIVNESGVGGGGQTNPKNLDKQNFKKYSKIVKILTGGKGRWGVLVYIFTVLFLIFSSFFIRYFKKDLRLKHL